MMNRSLRRPHEEEAAEEEAAEEEEELAKAEPLMRQATEVSEGLFGADNRNTLAMVNNLGNLLRSRATWPRPSRCSVVL